MKEKKIPIICPCEHKKEFEKTVTISNNKDGVNSFEITCPVCDDLLTIELPEKVANNSVRLRGLKKT